MVKILIDFMDEAYALDLIARLGYTKEKETYDNVNKIIPFFVDHFDYFIDLRAMESVSEEGKKFRINHFEEQIRDISSQRSDDRVYIQLIGHCGHFEKEGIDQIQHVNFDYLFKFLVEVFPEKKIIINLLGGCNSIYAVEWAKQFGMKGEILCTNNTTYDYLSPFQYLSMDFVNKPFDEFISKCGGQNLYKIIELQPPAAIE